MKQKYKKIIVLMCMLVLISGNIMSAFAADEFMVQNPGDELKIDNMVLVDSKTETLDNGYTMLTETYVDSGGSTAGTNATSKTISSKTHTKIYKNNTVYVQLYLYGTFTYDGTKSTCTSARVSTSGKGHRIYYATPSKKLNTAFGMYRYALGSDSPSNAALRITCSKNGKITS